MRVLLFLLALSSNIFAAEYNRKDWRHWTDEDRDGQNTRVEVLIDEAESVKLDAKGAIISGSWFDHYSGTTITSASKLDVDHLVPLGNAHSSGGSEWSLAKKRAYANSLSSPEHLIAVSLSENRAKGDKSPDLWMPSNKAFHCTYVLAWQSVKLRWGLTMTENESKFIANKIKECGL